MGFGVHQAPSSVLRAPREEGATCRAPGDPRDRAAGLPAQLASVQCGPCPSVFTWFKLEMSTTPVWTTASTSPGRRLETQGPAGSESACDATPFQSSRLSPPRPSGNIPVCKAPSRL